MQDRVLELHADLKKEFKELCSFHDQPALFLSNHFFDIRNSIDLDAEETIQDIEQGHQDQKQQINQVAQINSVRSELISFIEQVEQSAMSGLAPDNKPSSEVYASIQQKLDQFMSPCDAASTDINAYEDKYVQLASEILAARDHLEKKLLGCQTLIYIPAHAQKLGTLCYLPSDSLNRHEISFIRSLKLAEKFRELNKEIEKLMNQTTKVYIQRPCVLTRNLILTSQIADFLFHSRQSTNHIVRFGKPSASSPDLLKDCKILCQNDLIEFPSNKLRESGIESFDDEAEHFFKDMKDKDGRQGLDLSKNRLRKLGTQVAPLLKRTRQLILSDNRLESVDENLLRSCQNLTSLEMARSCLPETRFGVDFLASLTKLQMLKITLPSSSPLDLAALQGLKQIKRLSLYSSRCLDASHKRQVLTDAHLEQLAALDQLNGLTLQGFELQVVNKDTLSRFKKLKSLELVENDTTQIHQEAFQEHKSRFDWIKITGNKITELHDNLFANQDELTSLYLQSNCISVLHELCFDGLSNLYELTLENNRIEHLPDGVFNSLCSLEMMNLTNNNIRRIQAGLFDGMFELKRLFLSHNPIEAIEAKSFDELRSLQRLELNNCKLKTISNQVFGGLDYLQFLALADNQIDSFEIVENEETSQKAITINDIMSPEQRDEVTNQLFDGMFGLTWLSLAGNRLEKLDLNCFYGMGELRVLDLSRNTIDQLNSESAEGNLNQLTDLNLQHNRLKSISPNAFSEAVQLELLNLSHNQLEQLDEDFFLPFEALAILNLNNNNLTMTITEDTFPEDLDGLKCLDLSHNSQVRIEEGALERMAKLNSFKFDLPVSFTGLPARLRFDDFFDLLEEPEMSIFKSDPDTLASFIGDHSNRPYLQNICILSIINCSLKSENAFLLSKFFPSLTELHLGNNQLTTIEASWFQDLAELRHLDISNNLIAALDDPELFTKLQALKVINISGNQLTRVHSQLFSRLYQLQALDLSNNQHLSNNIDAGLFRNLVGLETLNLSGTNLSFFDFSRLLNSCPELKEVNLANNQLDNRSFDREVISGRRDLVKLVLSANQLESIVFLRNIYGLEHLDLSNNRVNSLEEDGQNLLGRSSALKHLDLSGNRLPSIDVSQLEHLRSCLKHLDVSNNPLDKSFEPNAFQRFKWAESFNFIY